MNSTTVAAPATATLPALTTPFAVPASCTDVFNTTITYRTGVHGDATHYTVYAAFPQTTGGCQASGPNVLRDGATIIVRPGVCPSDWVAYNLRVDDPQYYPNPSDSASVTFEAVCCSSGFSATGTVNDIPSFGPACTKLVSETHGVTSGQTTTTLTVSAHAAWQVEWMASDAPTLTPQPPSMELCYDVQIPTWTPGAEATGRKKCKSLKESPDKHQYGGLIYVAIVLPTRIGIVGRTGAGKSSLTNALLRFAQVTDGRILIDGVDIAQVSLHQLRSTIKLIPQDPVPFSGTLRANADPFAGKTDEQVQSVLERVRLVRDNLTQRSEKSLALGLETNIKSGGTNLSHGERQLVCLARAILAQCRVLVVDEATSGMDEATDSAIQTIISEEFRDATVIVVAHKLLTVAGFDKIVVMSQGQALESGSPAELLLEKNGVFRDMVNCSGEQAKIEAAERQV